MIKARGESGDMRRGRGQDGPREREGLPPDPRPWITLVSAYLSLSGLLQLNSSSQSTTAGCRGRNTANIGRGWREAREERVDRDRVNRCRVTRI